MLPGMYVCQLRATCNDEESEGITNGMQELKAKEENSELR